MSTPSVVRKPPAAKVPPAPVRPRVSPIGDALYWLATGDILERAVWRRDFVPSLPIEAALGGRLQDVTHPAATPVIDGVLQAAHRLRGVVAGPATYTVEDPSTRERQQRVLLAVETPGGRILLVERQTPATAPAEGRA